jgi:hydrogenase maturation protein HypF
MALGYLLGAEAIGDGRQHDGRPGMGAVEELAAPFLARLDPREVALVRTQVARGLNAPVASSAGRLFDAAAALLGIRDVAEFEAQAAIDLELAAGDRHAEPLPWRLDRVDGLLVYDPRPTLAALLDGGAPRATQVPRLAAGFQAAIADVTTAMLHDARAQTGVRTVCLSGGVFQNRRLAADLLRGRFPSTTAG